MMIRLACIVAQHPYSFHPLPFECTVVSPTNAKRQPPLLWKRRQALRTGVALCRMLKRTTKKRVKAGKTA